MSVILRWQTLSLAHGLRARRRLKLRRIRARCGMRETSDPYSELTEAEFIKTYRLGKNSVRNLAKDLAPHMVQRRRSNGLSIITKIFIALAFYSTGSYQTLVGQSALHNASQKSVSRALAEVTEALNKVFRKYVKWPTQREERNSIKAGFYQKFGFPGVLGCIDGTHVSILRPQTHEERFFNRKGYHSLNVMIICDSDLNILCVDPSSPGSSHDSSVWQSHPLSNHMLNITRNGEQVFLLGDSGYPLRRTIMTPILNTDEGTPQHHYYNKHVTARNTVERCIGVLKARFRCLLASRALHYDPIKAGKIVNACCVLHNIANRLNLPFIPLAIEDTNTENLQQEQGEEVLFGDAEYAENINSRINIGLQEGRALQDAVVNRLWIERSL